MSNVIKSGKAVGIELIFEVPVGVDPAVFIAAIRSQVSMTTALREQHVQTQLKQYTQEVPPSVQ